MSSSRLINFAEAYKQLSAFDCIIDVRSPDEFTEDHIPGAINCPVLNNEERIKVGTLYKQVSAFEAKKIGAALVAKNIGLHIEQMFLDKPKEWSPLIYCWRGGNRSGAMTHIMTKIGWHAMQLDGGYKDFRRFIHQQLPQLAAQAHWVVVCGETGTGKSRLLQHLSTAGAQVIDLEKLAQHRGSVLGKLPNNVQPTQKFFETEIWRQLSHFDFTKPIYVEAESKKIGNLRVPDALMDKMRGSSCIQLTLALEHRIQLLTADYAHYIDNIDALNLQLACLTDLHGKEQIKVWSALAESGEISELIKQLLLKHYDPAYQKSVARNFDSAKQAKTYAIHNHSDSDFAKLAAHIIEDSSSQNGTN